MAHLLHLHPWDVERLTWSEWTDYRDWVEQHLGGGHGNR